MIDSHSLAEYSSQVLNASGTEELNQRLGLYRVFLKLYEHHRGLLDEILDLENTGSRSRTKVSSFYIQGVVQNQQISLVTNMVKGKTQAYRQTQNVWVIGRDRKASLPIQDRRLSRRHAAIQFVANQGFYLVDLDSTNGSFINGEPVRHCQILQDGAQVRLGSLAFTFFVQETSNLAEPIAPDLLKQINLIRETFALPVGDTTVTDGAAGGGHWDTPGGSADETSMFRLPPRNQSVQDSDSAASELSMAQRAEILDRFMQRQSLGH